MDAQVRNAINALARELRSTQMDVERLRRGRRGPQLGYSSIDSGALEVRDGETVRARIGWLPDGTVGMITEGGDPVSAPTTPIVTPSLGGLRVTWDGTLSGDLAIPGDFDHMAVHVSTTSGFTPSAATYVGSIRRAGEGGMLPVVPLPYVPHYVKLVPVTTGGVQGVPSAEAAATPLQTSGIDLQADSIEAVHIKAGAIEADKLEAILVLASTIIAGIPGAARVEMDQDGLRGYNELNELIFAIDSAGNAVFSGDIVASEITGSRFTMGAAPGPTGVIEGDVTTVVQRVQVGDVSAQLVASSSPGDPQARFSATSDTTNPSSPLAGFSATASQVNFVLDSSATVADGLPSVTGTAFPTSSQLVVWSERNNTSVPWASLAATGSEALGIWSSDTGAAIQVTAQSGWAGISAAPEASTVGQPAASPGTVYGFRRSSTDAPTLSLQSPMSSSGAGANRRSIIHVEGANDLRAYTVINHAARVHFFQGELVSGSTDTTTDGSVQVASTHSISAERHRPVSSSLGTPPTWSSPTTGSYVDFTSGQWPDIDFTTGWSGLVEVTILMAGQNPNSDASSISVGFRLSGSSSLAADLARCALVRSLGTGINTTCQAQASYVLQLNGNADYTLTPAYRLSSWNSTRPAFWDGSLANTITVRALT